MSIEIMGASEHNLRSVSVSIPEGIIAVTGVSGSGKSSLVFGTLHHEASRRLSELYRITPAHTVRGRARVDRIDGILPAIAVAQNVVNRNPHSTIATAVGIHPYVRLLYARFGTRCCATCGADIPSAPITRSEGISSVRAVLVPRAAGTHATLLRLLHTSSDPTRVFVDGAEHSPGDRLDPEVPHRITVDLDINGANGVTGTPTIHDLTVAARKLGALIVEIYHTDRTPRSYALADLCAECGTRFAPIEPRIFHESCPHCKGDGCRQCNESGLHPDSLTVRVLGYAVPELLSLGVDELDALLRDTPRSSGSRALVDEIAARVSSLRDLGLGYLTLDRSSPSLSRGEAQRLRLAVSLKSRLRMLHVLDEPTIGLHPSDTATLMRSLRNLNGPVVLVEHDPEAVMLSDHVIDLGPGGGSAGGTITFSGAPRDLLASSTVTGRAFSGLAGDWSRRPLPDRWLTIFGASANNLKNIDVRFPVGRLSVVTGVSGSGKSSLVHRSLARSIESARAVNCASIDGAGVRCTIVDQSPIGKNPRSNPATYTKLADTIRELFAAATGESTSRFSFNRKEGACPACKGIGAIEIQMRYLPSVWHRCRECDGRRFTPEVLALTIPVGGRRISIADFLEMPIRDLGDLFSGEAASALQPASRRRAQRIVNTLTAFGLGYLQLGQPSPTLSGGEAQRVKLTKYLGRTRLDGQLLILDEPSTGLHPANTAQLLEGLDRLVDAGTTVIVVEHNLDIIRAADWVVDLGPGAGPNGGSLVYAGSVEGLLACRASRTAEALRGASSQPRAPVTRAVTPREEQHIEIRGASTNNLRGIDVTIPHRALTVVTGVSGSGKSSLVRGVLEAEGRARFLETLSMYERQRVVSGGGRAAAEIEGLGVTVAVDPARIRYSPRSTVGTATDLHQNLAVLFSRLGSGPRLPPESFFRTTYRAACTRCHGVGTLTAPNPHKLITRPDLPLCGGAMHSPGFFPRGYLCKPYNGGYDEVRAFALRHGFDPATTPWNEMTKDAQHGFLFGEEGEHEVTFESKAGIVRTRVMRFAGFYGWIANWDMHGTYTDSVPCPECSGSGLREEPRSVRLAGEPIERLLDLPLDDLTAHLLRDAICERLGDHGGHLAATHARAVRRLRFLIRVGLSYLTLNRLEGTLSAGEAQRVRLAGLLDSGLSRLTILLDEPTRGMHPDEIKVLLDVLRQLARDGSTVIVIEHETEIVRGADHVIELGPGAGHDGGRIVYAGSPDRMHESSESRMWRWLAAPDRADLHSGASSPATAKPVVRSEAGILLRGARGNNLKSVDLYIPSGTLTGVCGPSGSGKSTLVADTLARLLAPVKHTTSVASEPVDPEPFDSIAHAPGRTIVIDQSRTGLSHPGGFLRLDRPLASLFASSPDALDRGIGADVLTRRCEQCGGTGVTRHEMGFLPPIRETCEACAGTGLPAELHDLGRNGVRYGELAAMTLEQVREAFQDEESITRPLGVACDLGLGYLTLRQPPSALSGGEAQRLRIAAALRRPKADLYILDEPTVGQSNDDVLCLIRSLRKLVTSGRTVLVVEHHPLILAACDWLVELGPGAADRGGEIVAEGRPEDLANGSTTTAPHIKRAIARLYGTSR